MMLVTCFVILFGVLFATNIKFAAAEPEIDSSTSSEDSQEVITCDIIQRCEVYCYNRDNITSIVEATISNDVNCVTVGYHLHLSSPKFSTISPGWFTTSAIINKITFRDVGKIVEIQPGAFDDCTFRSVSEIEFRGTAITVLKNGAFDGLSNLKHISFYANNLLKGIEENVFAPLYRLVEFTMEEHKDVSDLVNITGKTEWKYLQSLNLRKNSFRSSIKKPTFKGCARVKILNLSNSGIEAIGPESFDVMSETIEVLDLSYNRLKQLPSLLLANLIKPNLQVYLSNNLWNCDCTSLELKGYVENNSSLIIDPPLLCETPKDVKGFAIKYVLLEECTLTTTGFDTTPLITTQMTPLPGNADRFKCFNRTDQPNESPYIALEAEYQYFSITEEFRGAVSIYISYPDSSLAMVLIDDHDYEVKCQYDVKRKLYFDDLKPNAGYLFCLIKKNEHTTSPRNCIPFHFSEKKTFWGRDSMIITIVCSIALALVVGALMGWLLIYRHQRFQKTKNILNYHSRENARNKIISADLRSSILPEYHKTSYFRDSNFRDSNFRDSNFRDSNSTAKPLRRSYSENSLTSCESYIIPSPFEICQRNNERNTYHINYLMDRLEYDLLPPPLPPHPHSRFEERIYETIAEPACKCSNDIVPSRDRKY